MKFTLLCLCMFCLSVEASPQRVTLNLQNTSLNTVLKQLSSQTGVRILYDVNLTSKIQCEKADFEEEELGEVLTELLQNTSLGYKVINGVYVIQRKETATPEVKIFGIVRDDNRKPLPGVTIVLKGTSTAAISDSDGKYTLSFPDTGNAILFYSCIGMKTKEVHYTGQAEINVTLEETTLALDQVVVTGIFTRKQESYTGSAVTIAGSDLKRVGNQNLFQSLKNLDPSLNIFSNFEMGSDPNTLPNMQLRGTSTFPATDASATLRGNYMSNPNTPLFILDGFETTLERVFDMDMNRIESVTLLKDAAAKAIYGSKASNGVIVIETKRLKGNQTRVTYNGNLSLEIPDLTSYDLCNALEKLQVEMDEGFYSQGVFGPAGEIDRQILYNQRLQWAKAGNSTYWLSKPLKVGIGHKHNISVELGESAIRAIADFTYNDVQGVMKGSDRKSIQGDINLMYRHKNVIFKNLMSISSTKSNDSPYGSFSQYAQLNPYWYPYDGNGRLKRILEGKTATLDDITGNPLYDAQIGTSLQSSYIYLNNNFYAEVNILNGLKAIASVGISAKRMDAERFYPSTHSRFLNLFDYNDPSFELRKGFFGVNHGKNTSLDGKIDIQYNRTFGKHTFFGDLSYQIMETKYTENSYSAEGFPSDKMNNISFARQYTQGTTPQSFDAVNRSLGLLAYLSYNYDDRYVLDFTERANAASVFGNDNPWANFWSLGVAWNLHNESFLKNLRGLTNFRIRGSYGTSGNQNFALNTSFSTYGYNTTGQYNGFIGATLQNMENPKLLWEQKKEYNVGMDLSFRGLNLRFDYYNALTSNMVTDMAIAPSTGFNTVRDNLGEVRNSGIEVNLNYMVWQGSNGFFNISGGITTNKNRIVKLSNSMQKFNERQLEIASGNEQSQPVLRFVEGMPLNAIWAVPSLGIDPNTGREVFRNKAGEKTYDWSANDMVYTGTTDPKYTGLVGFNGEYKGFGVSVSGSFLGGSHYYNYTLIQRVEDIDMAYNVDRRVLTGRWTKPGQNSQYTSLHQTYTPVNAEGQGMNSKPRATRATTRFVQQRNEFSITSVSAYYDFKPTLVKKIGLQQLRLAFYMNDLATFSTVKIERGTAYPFARTMSFSLTATF